MKIIPVLLALGLAVGGFVTPAVPTALDDGSLSIVAAPAFSGVLRSDQGLRVSGEVSNSTSQTMDASTATVYLSESPITTRPALLRWVDNSQPPDGAALGIAIGSIPVGELAAGQNRPFTLVVPASQLQFLEGHSGVYRLTVRLAAGSIVLASFRSIVTAVPSTTSVKTNLVVVAPLVAPPSTTGLISAEDLALLTAPGGSLDRQLAVALAHTVAIGVDPSIVASIRILGTSAPRSATDWLNRLENSTSDVFALPYADTDLRLLRQTGATTPLQPLPFPVDDSLFPAQPEESPQGGDESTTPPSNSAPSSEDLFAFSTTITGLAWPRNGNTSQADLDFGSLAGYTRTFVSSANVSGPQKRTPTGTVGSHEVIITDADASGFLRSASTAPDRVRWSQSTTSLAGLLAISGAENPGATVVVPLGRDGSASGLFLNDTLDSVDMLPWVSARSLASALTLPATPVALLDAPEDTDRVDTGTVMLASEAATERFSTVANDPTLITGPERLSLLALFSVSWSEDAPGWAEASKLFLVNAEKLRSSVQIPESSQVNLLQEKSSLHIAVRNELGFPVTVLVAVQPERGILDVLDEQVELTIEANSQAKASIPVQSVANGDVRTMVSLTSLAGVRISTPTFIDLNVQAGWETVATVIMAIIIVLLFGAGIWRTILRSRKKVKPLRAANPSLEDAS